MDLFDMDKDHGWVEIEGQVPSKSNCYKVITLNGHGSIAKQKVLKDYEEMFYWRLPGSYRNLGIDAPFEFHVRVYFTTMSHDLDNAMKVLLDCLEHTKTIKNDNRCCKIVAEKFIDKNRPRIEFKIVEI